MTPRRAAPESPRAPSDHPMAEAVRALCAEPLDLVVHLGTVDAETAAAYAEHPPRQLVIVDPHPGHRPPEAVPRAHWCTDLVAPGAGPACFRWFNWPRVDGLLPAGRLSEQYPGLVELGGRSAPAITLADLLAPWLAADGTEAPVRALVIDRPGQELALVASLQAALVSVFQRVVFRGIHAPLLEGSAPARDLFDRLVREGWRAEYVDVDSDPAWPVRLMRPRAIAQEQLALRNALRDAEAEAEALRAERDRLTAEVAAALAETPELRERLRRERQQSQEQIRKLTEELHEARQSAAHALKLSLLRDGDLRDLQARHAELLASRDALAQRATELAVVLDTLRARLDDPAGSSGAPA